MFLGMQGKLWGKIPDVGVGSMHSSYTLGRFSLLPWANPLIPHITRLQSLLPAQRKPEDTGLRVSQGGVQDLGCQRREAGF